MKKVALLVLLLLVGVFFVGSQSISTVSSAGAGGVKNTDDETERRALAATIKRLTNRSDEGLQEKRTANGTVALDLEDRFQNVMLSRTDADGEPIAACVTGLNEANAFFGRNLETGDLIFGDAFPKSETAKLAARHGMDEREYVFYKNLIEEAAQQRALSPNLATINIVNGDGADEGFNDATAATPEGGNTGTTRGQQRLNLFNFAAQIWGAFLDSSVPININSQFNALTPCSSGGGVLGSAGTATIIRDFPNAEFAGTWYHAALANKRAGEDLSGATQEINARFNSDVDNSCLGGTSRFYYGLNNTTPSQRINLLIVLLHEMGHGLGFSGFANGSTGALNGGFPDVYIRLLYDRTVNKTWSEMTNAERQASAINTGNLLWNGANVRTASSFLVSGRETTTGRVQMFAPATFSGGSSVSHFDTAASPNLLMEPNISVGLPLTLDLTRQQMRDVGWYRDSTADLVPDTITSVTPSGGTLVIGSTVTISWTNTGGFDRNVTIDLSTDGGATYPTTIASDIANTGTFTWTVPNTLTTQGKIRVREHNFVNPVGESVFSFNIATTAPTIRPLFDYDGDGRADLSVFRPANGAWYLQQSSNGFTATQFGVDSDTLAPADYDGDGKTDLAVYRANTWYLQRSSQGFTSIQFGASGDIPAPADFDGDGKADLAVFRPSNGTWYLQRSQLGFVGVQFGQNGDKPVAADYDGDTKADLAVNRGGIWYIQRSQLGFVGTQFGDASDKLVPADYDGDGKADVAVFRPSNGTWYLNRSQLGFTGISFGLGTDLPAAADYDGDGKSDLAVFRNGTWYLNRSTQGFTGVSFGATGDKPTPNAFVR